MVGVDGFRIPKDTTATFCFGQKFPTWNVLHSSSEVDGVPLPPPQMYCSLLYHQRWITWWWFQNPVPPKTDRGDCSVPHANPQFSIGGPVNKLSKSWDRRRGWKPQIANWNLEIRRWGTETEHCKLWWRSRDVISLRCILKYRIRSNSGVGGLAVVCWAEPRKQRPRKDYRFIRIRWEVVGDRFIRESPLIGRCTKGDSSRSSMYLFVWMIYQ